MTRFVQHIVLLVSTCLTVAWLTGISSLPAQELTATVSNVSKVGILGLLLPTVLVLHCFVSDNAHWGDRLVTLVLGLVIGWVVVLFLAYTGWGLWQVIFLLPL